jgi:hypothetical protein
MSLQLKQCLDDAIWDQLVEDSAQGSIFCSSGFLAALGESYERYLVLKSDLPVAGALLMMRDGVPLPAPYPFSCYHGIMFNRSVNELPLHRGVPERLRLVDFLLAELSSRHSRLSFCLHHEFTDVRSFLWFNYHEPEKGQFTVGVQYTAVLDFSESETKDEYLRQVREVRRQEYNRARKEGVTIECSDDIDLLDSLHDLTFKRQSISRSADEVRLIRSISQQALKGQFGKLWVARSTTGEAASAYLFLFDRKCAYYLFAANNPDLRKTGASSYLMCCVIDALKSDGIRRFDFCGINSPNRGDFKTSFNAKPTPWFIVDWVKP